VPSEGIQGTLNEKDSVYAVQVAQQLMPSVISELTRARPLTPSPFTVKASAPASNGINMINVNIIIQNNIFSPYVGAAHKLTDPEKT
jgi:hypothetical protein